MSWQEDTVPGDAVLYSSVVLTIPWAEESHAETVRSENGVLSAHLKPDYGIVVDTLPGFAPNEVRGRLVERLKLFPARLKRPRF
jgi:hypothetical protein